MEEKTNTAAQPRPKLWGVLSLLIAIVLLLAAGYCYQTAQVERADWLSAEGSVVRLIDENGHDYLAIDEDTHAYPLLRFTAADGKEYEVQGATGSRPPSYSVGDKETLLYPEEDPAKAVIGDSLPKSVLTLGLIGICLALLGILFLFAKPTPRPDATTPRDEA